MASISLRLKPKPHQTLFHLHHHLYLSSSTSSPPPNGRAGVNNEEGNTSSSSSSSSSYFNDIKARLRQSSPSPLRIPLNPPKPNVLNSPNAAAGNPSKVASLEEIRKNLAEFRHRSAPPPPNSSSSPARPLSFHELYKSSVLDKSGDGGADGKPDRLSFETIRKSLRQAREGMSPHSGQKQSSGLSSQFRYLDSPGSSPLSLNSLNDRLQIVPGSSSGMSPFHGKKEQLPHSIFGKELDRKADTGKVSKERKTEFLKMYTYDELGKKLQMLRPDNAVVEKGKTKKGSFSLGELNERLAKLREMEEEETEARIGGVSFQDLRESLVKLRDSENVKKSSLQKFSIFAHIGGQVTPGLMLSPPKEHLVEKYFHPDLMSSQEVMKLELQKVRDEFKMSESDCGSARVQVAQLTTKIKHLSSVLHKKDKHSGKGLQAMVQRRRKLLKYLRRTDWESYYFVLSKLGLRDAPDYRA